MDYGQILWIIAFIVSIAVAGAMLAILSHKAKHLPHAEHTGEPNGNRSQGKFPASLVIGTGIGIAIGVAMDNVGAGIAIGIAIGIALGVSQGAIR